jgi:hypothetical protein
MKAFVSASLAIKSIGRMTLMKCFPADKDAREELVRLVLSMASSNDQIDWLASRTIALHNERQERSSLARLPDGVQSIS